MNRQFDLFLLPRRSHSTMPQNAIELFRAACGLQAPLSLECRDASRALDEFDTHQFDYPFAIIGRDPRSDVVLQGAEVSRLHALFQVVEGRIFCIDLNSRTQLRWEGESEREPHGWLDPGGTVWIGPHGIRQAGADLARNQAPLCPDPLASCASDTADALRLPGAGLDLPFRIGEGDQLWRMDSRIALVGRSESCQIMLRDASVSRFHASLLRTSEGVWIVDLQSREGVVINGVRVKWAWLEDGDTVRIGRFTFILRYENVPAQLGRKDVPLGAGASPAVSSGPTHSGKGGTSLAIRAPSRPATPARDTRQSPALTPDLLVPERAAQWEHELAVPPQQLAMWQQQMQMMESFHQDMILMVQMFVAMHREHRVAIRDELDRVQKLTRKLGVLQKRLSQTEGSRRGAAFQGANRPETVAAKPERRIETVRPEIEGTTGRPTQSPGPPAHQAAQAARLRTRTPITSSKDHTRKPAGPPASPTGPAELHAHLHPADRGTSARATELLAENPECNQQVRDCAINACCLPHATPHDRMLYSRNSGGN